MADYIEEENESESSVNLLLLLKKYVWLILAIVVGASVIGFAFAKLRSPMYTAKETLGYQVSLKEENQNITEVNIRRAFYDTMLDFCKTGVVIDRANYYYTRYNLSKGTDNGGRQNIDEYISSIDTTATYDTSKITDKPLNKDNVTVSSVQSDDKINMVVAVKNRNVYEARILVRLLSVAISAEAKTLLPDATINIKEMVGSSSGVSGITYTKDISTLNIVLISALIGVVISAVVIYILQMLSNRIVVTEDELNQITGVNLLAKIEFVEK